MPRELEKKRLLNEIMGLKVVDGKPIDPKMKAFTDGRIDADEFNNDVFPLPDAPHPDEPGRTLLTDVQKGI